MFKLAIVGFFVFFGSVFAQNDTALWQAAREGNLDAVKEALARGANPNWEHPTIMLHNTALDAASWFNHPAIVSALLEAGADKKRTALTYAIVNEEPEIVKLLLNAGADPNAQEHGNGTSMLFMATFDENIDVMKALLEGGADPNFQVHELKTRPGYTPLFAAARGGNVATANVLFDAHANVTIVADDGSTALHHAVFIYQRPALADESNQQMIQRLLRKGADVNQKDFKGNTPSDLAIMFNKPELANMIKSFTGPYDTPLIGTYTPVEDKALWQAALDGNLDAVNGALARGANPNTWGNMTIHQYDRGNTQTALNVASHNNDPAVVSALLDAGADNTYGRGTIALNYAAQFDALEVVKVLLNAGADPNVQENGNGRTSLYIAAGRGNIDVINALLEGGADPNIQRYDDRFYAGYTPLFKAADFPAKISIFKALIGANANVGIVPDDGSTVLHRVVKYGETNQKDIVRLLLRKGADLNQKDNKGRTPSDIALQYFKPELANIIESYNGPYDPTATTTTPVYDLYLMACRVTKLIAETLYSALN